MTHFLPHYSLQPAPIPDNFLEVWIYVSFPIVSTSSKSFLSVFNATSLYKKIIFYIAVEYQTWRIMLISLLLKNQNGEFTFFKLVTILWLSSQS